MVWERFLSVLDGLDQTGDDLAEGRFFHAVAQIGEAFQQGDAGTHQLFEIEEEGDEIGAFDLLCLETVLPLSSLHQSNQTATLQAQLQIHQCWRHWHVLLVLLLIVDGAIE
jgi:hypothetical protein